MTSKTNDHCQADGKRMIRVTTIHVKSEMVLIAWSAAWCGKQLTERSVVSIFGEV